MTNDAKTNIALELLRSKARELNALPKKSDFSPTDVCFIKQKLGAWPRALEAAGLKEPPAVSAKQKSYRKRQRMKKARKQNKTERRNQE